MRTHIADKDHSSFANHLIEIFDLTEGFKLQTKRFGIGIILYISDKKCTTWPFLLNSFFNRAVLSVIQTSYTPA